jgi:hypothetical protein
MNRFSRMSAAQRNTNRNTNIGDGGGALNRTLYTRDDE